MSHELGAETGELMHSEEKSGGNSLGRSSDTMGCSTNGKRRRRRRRKRISLSVATPVVVNIVKRKYCT
jgi:hypothetical protein